MKRKRTTANEGGEPDVLKLPPLPRRPTVIALWLVFLGVVIVVISSVVPLGRNSSPMRTHRAKQQMASAESMESQELWRAAADTYTALADDEQLKPEIRSEAAQKLASIYSHKLNDEERAKKALEKAQFYAKDDRRKNELKAEREQAAGDKPPVPGGPSSTVKVAKIGDQTVTLEEILYAFKRINASDQPTTEKLEAFTNDYMNNILLSEEAARRGKDGERNFTLEMGFYKRQMLAQALLRSLVPDVDETSTKRYYLEHLDKYQAPSAFNAEHIIVGTKPDAEKVGSRLGGGEDFGKIASEVSLDKNSLPQGRLLGRIESSSEFVPYVGVMPGLSAELAKHDEGYTTGPIQSARGFHWIKIDKKFPPAPAPFEEVKEKVERDLRREQFEGAQKELLAKLKKSIPIEVYEGAIGDAVKRAAEAAQAKMTPAPTGGPGGKPPKPPARTPASTPSPPEEKGTPP